MRDAQEPTYSTGSQPGARFSIVRWREGYNSDEVDAFLVRADAGSLTSAEVEKARFTPVRLRPGYSMSEVDAYLDTLVSRLRASGR